MLRIVLIAHDAKKKDMVEWLRSRRKELSSVELFATRATGEEILSKTGMQAYLLPDGPDGGDELVAGMVEEGLVDLVIFFWDPRSLQPHEVDANRLLRLAYVYDVPTALNPWTADFFFSSLQAKAASRQRKIAI
jgi:methylglyoxal synthase